MTKIEWVKGADGAQGKTWNPLAGCSVVSPGCKRCYAMRMAARLEAMGVPHYVGLTQPSKAVPVWTGKMAQAPVHILTEPMSWKKATTVFVGSMADMCHESVPDAWRDRVLAVVALTPHHTYQWLTKRAAILRKYFSAPDLPHRVQKAMDEILVDVEQARLGEEEWRPVVGFDGLYEVSSFGQVRRLWKKVAPQILAPIAHCRGYVTVALSANATPRHFLVHRIVLEAFVGAPAPAQEALHRNGNKTDNRLANLRWGTRAENMEDAARHGTAGSWMKTNAKLSAGQVREIRERRKRGEKLDDIAAAVGSNRQQVCAVALGRIYKQADLSWPLNNLWLGVSAEDQARADERIPDLLATPAAVRFVSAEPLLGPIDFTAIKWPTPLDGTSHYVDALRCGYWNVAPHLMGARSAAPGEPRGGFTNHLDMYDDGGGPIRWVIVGGESGAGSRPFDLTWARSIVAQCKSAGVACFVKQMGAQPFDSERPGRETNGEHLRLRTLARKGDDPLEWPADLRVREMPEVAA